MSNQPKHIEIYTHGTCDSNLGRVGGYGIILTYNGEKKEISGGISATTKSRIEVYPAIKGLEALKTTCQVTLYSDSKYLVDTMTEGLAKAWKTNGWRGSNGKRAKHMDLWDRLLSLCETHDVQFELIRGYDKNPFNERCDYLSGTALKQKCWPFDRRYENLTNLNNIADDKCQKVRIGREGQQCRYCHTPVVKSKRRNKKPRHGQKYYFEYYLYCPTCRRQYFVDEAKRYYEE